MSLKSLIKRSVLFILHGLSHKEVVANISYLSPDARLSGKKIIVTGGGRGLGASMAAKFVSEGASVLIAGRNVESLQKISNQLGCKYLQIDMQDVSSFDTFIATADGMLDGVDCLVNNAGISLHEQTFFDVTPESFDAQIGTNLRRKCIVCFVGDRRNGRYPPLWFHQSCHKQHGAGIGLLVCFERNPCERSGSWHNCF